MKLPLILALCLLHFHSTVAEYAGAICNMGTYGAIYFREMDGLLQGVIKAHRLSAASSDFELHIHENPKEEAEPYKCNGIGNRFDPLHNKAGNLGFFRSGAQKELHTDTFTLPFLLSGTDDGGTDVGIIGRSIAIHDDIGIVELCCDIEGEAYDEIKHNFE